jgi:chromosomal replication initiation ATPase DnaA
MRLKNIQELVDVSCLQSGITTVDFLANITNRKLDYMIIRKRVFWVLKQLSNDKKINMTEESIGAIFGQDRTTVLHAHRTYPNLWLTDSSEKKFAENLYTHAKNNTLPTFLYQMQISIYKEDYCI